ncbi:hypothetical protein VCV18_004769 [Metarhizium anisopliae]
MWHLDLRGDVLFIFTTFAGQKENEYDEIRNTNADASETHSQAVELLGDSDAIDKAATKSQGE